MWDYRTAVSSVAISSEYLSGCISYAIRDKWLIIIINHTRSTHKMHKTKTEGIQNKLRSIYMTKSQHRIIQCWVKHIAYHRSFHIHATNLHTYTLTKTGIIPDTHRNLDILISRFLLTVPKFEQLSAADIRDCLMSVCTVWFSFLKNFI